MRSIPVTLKILLAVAVGILAGFSLAGCATMPRRPIDSVGMVGEEVLLNEGDPAPFRGILLPPGIYKGAIDCIDQRYEEIYGTPRRYERNELQKPVFHP